MDVTHCTSLQGVYEEPDEVISQGIRSTLLKALNSRTAGVSLLCDWTHTHTLTHSNTPSEEPVFLHMGPRWGERTG